MRHLENETHHQPRSASFGRISPRSSDLSPNTVFAYSRDLREFSGWFDDCVCTLLLIERLSR
jgi:site-specific recombinase XerD